MHILLAMASVFEAVTGLFLLIVPTLVVRLFLGADVADVGIVVCRIAGAGFLGLGVACWPGPFYGNQARQGLVGMLTYNLIVTPYFFYLGIVGEWVGLLLWPAALIHVTLTVLLGLNLFKP